jgi:putative oxidoreductase
MDERGRRWVDVGLLVLRLGFGLGFVFFHGWAKLTGGPERWAGVGSAVEHLGIGVGHTAFGFLAALAEAVGGLCIAAGLLFRPAAALLAGTMFVAWLQHVITGSGTPAHAFKNLWVALGLAVIGPGRYSVDHWLASRNQPPEIEIPRDPSR